jgi:hypothetical protein
VLIELDQISIAEVDHFCIAGNNHLVCDIGIISLQAQSAVDNRAILF